MKFCTQLAVGYLGDKIRSKYGRRKPFLVVGYLVKAIALLFLSAPLFKSGQAVFGWYTLFYTLFQIGTELTDGPFDAWMIETSRDDEDYRKIYSVAGPIGGFIGGVTGLVLTIFFPLVGALIFLIGSGLMTYLTVSYISSHVTRVQPALPELVPSVRICARTNEFQSIFCLRVLVNSGANIFITVVGYYVLIGFDINNVKAYVNYLLIGSVIGASIGIPLTVMMNWILVRYDKITLYLTLMVLVIFLGFVAFFVTIPGVNSFEGYLTVLSLINALSYPAKLFDQLIIRDLITYDNFMTGSLLLLSSPLLVSSSPLLVSSRLNFSSRLCLGLNRENMYLMALSLPTTILSTFIGGIPAMVIMFCGYSEDTDVDDDEVENKYDWTKTTLWFLRICGSFVFSLLACFAFLILKRYSLTSAVAQQMNAVNKRREEQAKSEELEEEMILEERRSKRELRDESNPLQLGLLESSDRAVEDHVPFSSSSVSSSSALSPSMRYLFLHFSAEELYLMASFPTDSSDSSFSSSNSSTAALSPSVSSAISLQHFYYIQFLNSIMLYLGIFAGLCVVTVIIVDISVKDGGLSTLFINVLMILIFFVLYSLFRYFSLKKMQQIYHLASPSSPSSSSSSAAVDFHTQPSPISFHTSVQLVYYDFTHYHQSLKEMLKKEEIISEFYSSDHSSSLVDPIVEDSPEVGKLRGFKRIFVGLILIIVVSIVVIVSELL
jgi:Na+/melibiose symporter-like transporter